MKFYFVEAVPGPKAAPEQAVVSTWASTLKEVSEAKAAMKEKGFKRTQISTTEADIPTSKAELLEWLKSNVKSYAPSA